MSAKGALFFLHVIVVLYGFTGILGKLIDISSLRLVWYRVGIATLTLLVLAPFFKRMQVIKGRKHLTYISFVGIFLALHWVAFFEAIVVSNVTVCLIGMSTFPFFTAVLEPLYFKEPFSKKNLGFGALIIAGIGVISIGNSLPSHIYLGLFYGAIAALLATFFTIMNRQIVRDHNGFTLGVYQLGIAFIFLSLLSPSYFASVGDISQNDFIYLLILAVLCTAVAHVINIAVMKHIKAFVVSLVINLEPVYGIVLAAIIFNENEALNLQFYLGSAIILGSVFLQPIVSKKQKSEMP